MSAFNQLHSSRDDLYESESRRETLVTRCKELDVFITLFVLRCIFYQPINKRVPLFCVLLALFYHVADLVCILQIMLLMKAFTRLTDHEWRRTSLKCPQ